MVTLITLIVHFGESECDPERQSRVNSATAFFAQSSSTSALPAVVAAISGSGANCVHWGEA